MQDVSPSSKQNRRVSFREVDEEISVGSFPVDKPDEDTMDRCDSYTLDLPTALPKRKTTRHATAPESTLRETIIDIADERGASTADLPFVQQQTSLPGPPRRSMSADLQGKMQFTLSTGAVMVRNSDWAMPRIGAQKKKEADVMDFERKHAESKEVCFDEVNEKRTASMRKRVLPQSAIGWTENCVVLDQQKLPDYLFTDLSLVDAGGKLVSEISYNLMDGNQRPRIYYSGDDPPSNDAQTQWVQVVTKNSYWNSLSWAVTKAMLFAMTEYSHFAFIAHVPSEIAIDITGGWNKDVRGRKDHMIAVLLIFYCLRFGYAAYSARMEWLSDEDIVTQSQSSRGPTSLMGDRTRMVRLRTFHRFKAFLALLVFNVLGITGNLREITNFLHPWKGVQPFAAFKADGSRNFLLGFPSAAFYRVVNRPRQQGRYFFTALQAFFLTFMKILIFRHYANSDAYTPTSKAVALIPGSVTMLINIWGAFCLRRDKATVKQMLLAQLKHSDPKQQQVAQRLLKKLFGLTYRVDPAQSAMQSAPRRTVSGSLNCDKVGLARVGEIARELQLWSKSICFDDELERMEIKREFVDKFLWAVRDIALEKNAMSANDQSRGPLIPNHHRDR